MAAFWMGYPGIKDPIPIIKSKGEAAELCVMADAGPCNVAVTCAIESLSPRSPLPDRWQTDCRPLADQWQNDGIPMADRWQTDGRPMAD